MAATTAADATYIPGLAQVHDDGGTVMPTGNVTTYASGSTLNIASGAALQIAGTTITATAAEINAIAGGGLSATELGYLDTVVAGTVTASKAVVVDTNKHIDVLGLPTSGLKIGVSGSETVVSCTGAELNKLAGVTGGTNTASKALVVGASNDLDLLTVTTLTAPTIAGTTAHTGRVTTTDGVASGTARVVGGMAFSDVAAADVVTAAASNNAFVSFAQTYAIPASTLKAGSLLRIRAQVTVNDASGADTLTCNIRVGGTSMIASTAVNPGATTDHHILEFNFVSRAAAGAAASCAGYGQWFTNTGGTMATASAILAPTNFATNGALTVDVQAKWSSNTASTSARLELLNVEII